MSDPRPRVSDLTPEELELLALEHVESMFIELRATSGTVGEQCRPAKLIERHPFLVMGIAAGAGFMLARHLQRKPGGKAAAAAPGWFDSLLSAVAGAALPGLVASWLAQGKKPD
ncbi:MAG: hypothetical protein ACLQVA_07720 [Candidatus Brocadiia bacterium]